MFVYYNHKKALYTQLTCLCGEKLITSIVRNWIYFPGFLYSRSTDIAGDRDDFRRPGKERVFQAAKAVWPRTRYITHLHAVDTLTTPVLTASIMSPLSWRLHNKRFVSVGRHWINGSRSVCSRERARFRERYGGCELTVRLLYKSQAGERTRAAPLGLEARLAALGRRPAPIELAGRRRRLPPKRD